MQVRAVRAFDVSLIGSLNQAKQNSTPKVQKDMNMKEMNDEKKSSSQIIKKVTIKRCLKVSTS